MSTNAATVEKPSTTGNKPPKLRHIYCRCDRDAQVRTAFCGHTVGPGVGTAYDPRNYDPDLCRVCQDLYNHGCPRCK
jgi:hypothetical protein